MYYKKPSPEWFLQKNSFPLQFLHTTIFIPAAIILLGGRGGGIASLCAHFRAFVWTMILFVLIFFLCLLLWASLVLFVLVEVDFSTTDIPTWQSSTWLFSALRHAQISNPSSSTSFFLAIPILLAKFSKIFSLQISQSKFRIC